MTNLEWVAELMPDADGWVQGCIANALDTRDQIIAALKVQLKASEDNAKAAWETTRITDRARITEMEKRDALEIENAELREVAIALREWIDAVPSDTPLPVMPGVNRDWIDEVLYVPKRQRAEQESDNGT